MITISFFLIYFLLFFLLFIIVLFTFTILLLLILLLVLWMLRHYYFPFGNCDRLQLVPFVVFRERLHFDLVRWSFLVPLVLHVVMKSVLFIDCINGLIKVHSRVGVCVVTPPSAVRRLQGACVAADTNHDQEEETQEDEEGTIGYHRSWLRLRVVLGGDGLSWVEELSDCLRFLSMLCTVSCESVLLPVDLPWRLFTFHRLI